MTGKPRALYVVRRPKAAPQAGDQVHVRKMVPWLQARLDLNVLELGEVERPRRLINLMHGWPFEMTGLWSPENRRLLRDAIATHRPDYVYLINEALFPFARDITDAHVVLFAMNSISSLAVTDPSPSVRLMAPLARAYEDRYFKPRERQTLTLVSRADARWLRQRFATAERFPIAVPGALPSAPLDDDAEVRREILIAGSYDWWRKRRDLQDFARHDLRAPILVTDSRAAQVLGSLARQIDLKALDTRHALRFGVVTDRFLGGFKLKSLEYVANNAMVLSRSDIRPDFEGLPDAPLFVRYTPEVADVGAAIDTITAIPPTELIARFKRFQAACGERFAWEACLQPLAPPFVPNPSLDDPAT
jgi:hypothetical protein